MDQSLSDLFANELFALVEKYQESGISVSEVIGAFEIVKMETYFQQRIEEDE